jgi:hypothetical protein
VIFAMCVLVSHSIELVDGNRSREPLTFIFGTLSLGNLASTGFFWSAATRSHRASKTLRPYFYFPIYGSASFGFIRPLSLPLF